MVEDNCLQVLAKHHNKWLNIVRSLGETIYAEDIVQEMYLKVYEKKYCSKVVKDGKVNHSYVFIMIRHLTYTFFKEKGKIVKEGIDDSLFKCDDEDVLEKEMAYLAICENIDKEIDTWHWYDKEVFKIYRMHWRDTTTLNRLLEEFNGSVSIRKIAKNTNISWVTLFNELKESKAKIKEKFAEDWEDYINEEYHLINKQ